MSELLLCPFCGESAEIVACDDEGNFKNKEHEQNPWSGLCYRIVHSSESCPVRTDGGMFLYDTKEEAQKAWNRRAERTWHDFSDELPPAGVSVLCRGKNGALYVGKPVTFKGNGTRKVWVPRGDQYRTPEKWMEVVFMSHTETKEES